MYWIAKPLYLPLQMFFNTKNITIFQKTAARTPATEEDWRLLTSPIVEKKHVHFPTVVVDSRMSENDAEDMSEGCQRTMMMMLMMMLMMLMMMMVMMMMLMMMRENDEGEGGEEEGEGEGEEGHAHIKV